MKLLPLIIACFLTTLLHAKPPLPTLSLASGKKVQASPIGFDGNKITLKKADGSEVTAPLSKFSVREQVRLKLWVKSMQADHHQQLLRKVKSTDQLRVLFVGNSYSFNVPKAFEKLAKRKKKKLTVEQSTSGGWTLQKHAKNAKLLEKIKSEKFDIVVLQEQSMIPAFPEGQRSKMMDVSAKILIKTIRDSGALPIFFQTWGRRDGDQRNKNVFPDDTFDAMQKRLTQGYKNVAKASGGAHIVPVGEIWAAAHKKSIPDWRRLYTKDGSHPSEEGVKFTAAIFYSAIYNDLFHPKRIQLSDLSRPKPVGFPVK